MSMTTGNWVGQYRPSMTEAVIWEVVVSGATDSAASQLTANAQHVALAAHSVLAMLVAP